jgi:hypothetical protein
MMSDGEKYRGFAEECMRQAEETKNLKVKARLLEMAQEWFKLAIEADAEGGNGKGLVS